MVVCHTFIRSVAALVVLSAASQYLSMSERASTMSKSHGIWPVLAPSVLDPAQAMLWGPESVIHGPRWRDIIADKKIWKEECVSLLVKLEGSSPLKRNHGNLPTKKTGVTIFNFILWQIDCGRIIIRFIYYRKLKRKYFSLYCHILLFWSRAEFMHWLCSVNMGSVRYWGSVQ